MKNEGDLLAISLSNGRKFDVAIRKISTGRYECMQGRREHMSMLCNISALEQRVLIAAA